MNSIEHPSFMRPRCPFSGRVAYWAPVVTGDWGTDTSRGRFYADEAVTFISARGNPTILAHIMKSMVGQAAWGGVEVGFFHRLSEHLLAEGHREGRAEGAELAKSPALAGDRESRA